MAFHDIRFPTGISRAAQGGPERRTDVVVLGSGAEERNARWADSRRGYNAGYGVKSLNDLHAVIAFFEERRGRLHGFRWRDPSDWKSCPPEDTPSALDQLIGLGNGATAAFQLKKTYGAALNPWARDIKKPVDGSVLVAVAGATQTAGHGLHRRPQHRPRHLPRRAHPRGRRAPSPPASPSTCRCASTPTSSRSTSRASATAPSPPSPSSRSACDGVRPCGSDPW